MHSLTFIPPQNCQFKRGPVRVPAELVFNRCMLAAEPVTGEPRRRRIVTFQKNILPFLKAHCFHCHGKADAKNEADLNLVKYQDDLSIQQDREAGQCPSCCIGRYVPYRTPSAVARGRA